MKRAATITLLLMGAGGVYAANHLGPHRLCAPASANAVGANTPIDPGAPNPASRSTASCDDGSGGSHGSSGHGGGGGFGGGGDSVARGGFGGHGGGGE